MNPSASDLLVKWLKEASDKVGGDYSLLAKTDEPVEFLDGSRILQLRRLRASWQGGQIQYILRAQIKDMADAGIVLVELAGGHIYFKRTVTE